MMETLREQLKKQKWPVAIFLGILVIGIFLRTYQFHDWLRFNADQSRDATIVSEYLEGKSPLPLLGPKAGGTDFRVGPAFYHFQIAAGKIFGNAPDVMAYPDLLFSILAIPLLFLFLWKYFDTRTSLALAGIFAVSFYAVKYSRFAWNPNSLPFWSILFLFMLHEIAIASREAKKWKAAVAGVALGIGAQLHTLSLIFFPLMTVLVFAFLFIRKRMPWKTFFIMVALALFVNVPQIASEIQTGWANTDSFFSGVGTKEEKGSGAARNALKDIVCYAQANAYILSSYDSDDGCSLKSVKKGLNLPVFIAALVFLVGGLSLAVRAFLREADHSRKYFLGIVLLYLALSFAILLPLANEISMRFFLAMIFMPFVLLGLWFGYISEKFPRYGYAGMIILVSLFCAANLFSIRNSFADSRAFLSDSDAGMDNAMLREVEISSAFIISRAGGAKVVSVGGDSRYLFKALKSMNYFTSRSGIRLVQKSKKTDPGIPVFLIENTKRTESILKSQSVEEHLSFGRFTIFSIRQ